MAPRILVVLVLAFALVACRAVSPATHPEATALDGTVATIPDAPRVGRYVSSPWGFSTVSYWIEGEDGVVVIDTQFLPSAAEELVAAAERETGKPVVTAIVLHANPDKFNGTATLQARGIEVLTADPVLAAIPDVHARRLAAFGERYAPDYPTAPPHPDSFGNQRVLRRAGLELRLHVLGPGCSNAHVAVQWRDHLFVGDLVGSGTHAWLELGLADAWRERLAELRALSPGHVHPGRGPSGGPELLALQDEYLATVERLIAAEQAALPDDADRHAVRAATARVRAAVERAYPDYRFAVFLAQGIGAQWRTMRAAST